MRRFESFHPVMLLLYFLAILIPVMVFMNPWMIIAALVTGFIWKTMRDGRFPLGNLVFYLGLIFLVVVINAIIYSGGTTVLFYICGRAITWEGASYGLKTGGMLAAAFLWFGLMGDVLDSDATQRILAGMPKLALLITMILRLIPHYQRRYKEVSAAMGMHTTQNERVGMVVKSSAVLTWALENSAQTAEAMELRGFNHPKRTKLREPVYARDVIFLILILATMGGYVFEPWISVTALGLFPILYCGKEEIRWATHKNYKKVASR